MWLAPATVIAVPVPGVGGVNIAPGGQIIGAVSRAETKFPETGDSETIARNPE